MNNKLLFGVILWFSCVLHLTFCSGAFSDISCVAGTQKYRILFGNGILTDIPGAQNSRELTQQLIGDSQRGRPVTYDVVYNYSDGAFGDLLQSLDQKLDEEPDSFTWRNVAIWLGDLWSAENWFTGIVGAIFKKTKDYYAAKGDADLEKHILKYREAVLQGDMVLLVAHSQGNLFGNDAYRRLYSGDRAIPGKSFGIYSVATPANKVGGGGIFN